MSDPFQLTGRVPASLPEGCDSLEVNQPLPGATWARVGALLARHPKVELYLGPGQRDLASLRHTPGLRALRVGFAMPGFEGLAPVAPSLRRLELSLAAKGSSVIPVAACARLERLSLVGTGCRDLARLGELRRLRDLEVYGWPEPTLAALAPLRLRRLTLHTGQLQRLEGMPPVESLHLADLRRLRGLDPLGQATGLRALRLDGLRGAGPLPSLARLKQLERVVLVQTGFTDLGPLAEATALSELAVLNTSAPTVKSFRPLAGRRLRRLVVGLKSARKNQAVRALLGEPPEFDYWDEP